MIAFPWRYKRCITLVLFLVGMLSMIRGSPLQESSSSAFVSPEEFQGFLALSQPLSHSLAASERLVGLLHFRILHRLSNCRISQKIKTDFPTCQCLLTRKPTDPRSFGYPGCPARVACCVKSTRQATESRGETRFMVQEERITRRRSLLYSEM